MKILILLGYIAIVLSAPAIIPEDSDGVVSVVQSSDGSYILDVNLKTYSQKEERFENGTVIGAYSIPDASGVLKTIKNKADKEGFQILEGSLPVAPTPVEKEAPVVSEIPVSLNATDPIIFPVISEISVVPEKSFTKIIENTSGVPTVAEVIKPIVPKLVTENLVIPSTAEHVSFILKDNLDVPNMASHAAFH